MRLESGRKAQRLVVGEPEDRPAAVQRPDFDPRRIDHRRLRPWPKQGLGSLGVVAG
jgi:hypothetical protein